MRPLTSDVSHILRPSALRGGRTQRVRAVLSSATMSTETSSSPERSDFVRAAEKQRGGVFIVRNKPSEWTGRGNAASGHGYRIAARAEEGSGNCVGRRSVPDVGQGLYSSVLTSDSSMTGSSS